MELPAQLCLPSLPTSVAIGTAKVAPHDKAPHSATARNPAPYGASGSPFPRPLNARDTQEEQGSSLYPRCRSHSWRPPTPSSAGIRSLFNPQRRRNTSAPVGTSAAATLTSNIRIARSPCASSKSSTSRTALKEGLQSTAYNRRCRQRHERFSGSDVSYVQCPNGPCPSRTLGALDAIERGAAFDLDQCSLVPGCATHADVRRRISTGSSFQAM